MATSQYSILRQYQPYVSPYNLDLIKDVMLYKQGKVDVNREKINQQIDLLMGQQIAKPEARAYFENKMAGVLNRVDNMYRGADLSSDGVVRHIQGEISSVLDDTIINAIAGTKAGQQMMNYIHEVQLNHPKQYSAANAYMAMKPYYEWLQDGQAGSRLTPLNYTPYTDYNAELRENMQAILKSHKGTTFTQPVTDKDGNPTGAMMTITKDALTPQQAGDLAIAQMSQNARIQMQIEAQYMTDANPQAFSLDAALGYSESMIKQQNAYINYLNAEIAGAGSDTEKETALKNELNKAKADLASMQQNFRGLNDGSYSPVMGAAMVVENNFRQGAASMYAYDNSVMKWDKDPVYWEQRREERETRQYNLSVKKMELDQQKWQTLLQYRMDNDEANRQLRKEQLEIQRMRAMNAAAGSGARGRAGSNAVATAGLAAGTAGTVSSGTINTDDIDINKWHDDKFDETYNRLNTNSLVLQNAIGAENLQNIQGYIQQKMQDPTSGYQNISQNEAILKYFEENGGLSNAIFDGLSKDERFRAVSAYRNALAANRDMDVINDRLNEENSTIATAYSNLFRSRFPNGANVDDAFSFFAQGMNTIVGAERVLDRGGISRGYYTPEQKYNIVNRANALIDAIDFPGINKDELKRDVENMFKLTQDGRYDVDWYYNGDTDWTKRYIQDGVRFGSFTDEFRNNVQSQIDDIRKKYINLQSSPRITFNLKAPSSSEEYAEANNVRKLYEARTGVGLDQASSIVIQQSPLRSDNGEVMYTLTPVGNLGKGDDYKATEVSAAELGNYVNVGQGGSAIDVGGYDSGMRSLSFAKSTQTWYPLMLQTSGIDPMYANTESVLNDITTRLTQYGDGFKDDPDHPDPRRAVLINAAQKILNNYNKFNIRVEGFDDFGMGYNVYLYGVENGERPEKIMSYTSPTTAYADVIDEEIGIAPQVQFVYFLNTAISEELEAMIKGQQTIRANGKLAKMLNFINAQ